ncbi:MAG: hypothetical protein RL563_1643 [Pseudomonadota bacterium]
MQPTPPSFKSQCRLSAERMVNFETQDGRCQQKSHGICQYDGQIGQIESIDQPQEHTAGEETIHAQRQGIGVSGF